MGALLFLLAATIFIISGATISISGIYMKPQKSDVGIVLGSKVNPDGTVSVRLAARLDKAVELYHQGYFKWIIVSGGVGKEGHDEATVVQHYWINHGLPRSAIYRDSGGYNTMVTARNAANIMHLHQYKSALVVTQYFHIGRARLALNKCGINEISSASPHFFELRDIYSNIREVFGFYNYLLMKRC